MGLEKNTGRATFVNIKEGQLYTKEKAGAEPEFFGSLSGSIVKIDFKEDEYQGKKFEICAVTIVDKGERFLLQMRTDSGYFRGFCNSLRTGDATLPVTLIPSSKKENDKPKTTIFVNQNGKSLKHAFVKDNMGDLPPVESREWKGNIEWDGTAQIAYWKKWLSGLQLASEFLAENESPVSGEPLSPGAEAASFYNSPKSTNPADLTEPLDDLPF